MKRTLQNFYWLLGFLVAFAGLVLMYLIVDTETVQASNKFYNDTLLSDEAYEACMEIGQQYNVSPELLMAIAEAESSGNPQAYNAGCQGLMQVSVSAHSKRMQKLGVSDIADEYGNVLVATDYLLELFTEEEDVGYALSRYHGESNADSKYESGELSSYAEKILERAEELTKSHDRFSNAVG